MRKCLVWAMIFCLPLPLLANVNIFQTGDTMRYLTPEDTVFLTTDFMGEKVAIHTMEPHQTLYSLAQFYGLSLEELYFYNADAQDRNYGVGSKINVPIPNRSIIRFQPKDYSPYTYVPIFYIVRKGETMFHIAQRVFHLPIDTIMDRNNLVEPTLSVGQKLFMGWMSIYGVPQDYRQTKGKHPLSTKSMTYKRLYLTEKNTKKEYSRKGPAVYIEGTKSASDLLVMHRDAAIGSVVEITNPMNNRTVYARVIANTPPAYDLDIEVVVSPTVGKVLGAIDKNSM